MKRGLRKIEGAAVMVNFKGNVVDLNKKKSGAKQHVPTTYPKPTQKNTQVYVINEWLRLDFESEGLITHYTLSS